MKKSCKETKRPGACWIQYGSTNHQLRWIGHILRHDSLLGDIMEGRMMGKGTRGRKRIQMIGDITSKGCGTLKRSAEDRSLS